MRGTADEDQTVCECFLHGTSGGRGGPHGGGEDVTVGRAAAADDVNTGRCPH